MAPETVHPPNVESQVSHLLASLSLTPYTPVSAALRHRENNYATLATARNGQQVFFKVSLVDQQPQPPTQSFFPPRSVSTEILVYQAFSQINDNSAPLAVPKYIDGSTAPPAWIMLEPVSPDSLYTDKDQFSATNLHITLLDQVMAGVEYYQSLPATYPKFYSQLQCFNPDISAQLNLFLSAHPTWLNSHLGLQIADVLPYLHHTLTLWKIHNSYLAHGDFGFQNIGHSNGKLLVLDWEHAHLTSPTYDYAKIYVQAWNYPWLQDQLIHRLLETHSTQEFTSLFWGAVTLRALAEIRYLEACLQNPNSGYSAHLRFWLRPDRIQRLLSTAIVHHEKTTLAAISRLKSLSTSD